jgi:hypothetical protein
MIQGIQRDAPAVSSEELHGLLVACTYVPLTVIGRVDTKAFKGNPLGKTRGIFQWKLDHVPACEVLEASGKAKREELSRQIGQFKVLDGRALAKLFQ